MNKMKNLINDDFEPSSSDESYNESDNGSDNNKLNDQFVKINIVF